MSAFARVIIRNPVGRLAVVFAMLASTACGRLDTLQPSFGVHAELRDDQTVVVTNRTDAPVYTLVLGREVAMLALWATCVDATVCPPIPPGESRTYPVDLSAIDGIQVTAVNVYWWHAVPGPNGGLQPDSVRVEVLPL